MMDEDPLIPPREGGRRTARGVGRLAGVVSEFTSRVAVVVDPREDGKR